MTEARPVAVRVTFTLDVDLDAWETAYGVQGREAVRRDVKDHVEQSVRAHFGEMGLLA